MRTLLLALPAALLAPACDRAAQAPAAPPAPPFELVCGSTDTDTASSLHCMRIDSRDGEIRHVVLDKLQRTEGAAAAAGPPGVYQLACDATNTATKSDFRCLRMDRRTGQVELVVLPQVRGWPE